MIRIEETPEMAKLNAEISFLLFTIGAIAGLLNLTSTLPFGSGFEMVALATNLAEHSTFANPLQVLPSGPSALAPPLYPMFLAFLIKVLPTSQFVLLAAAIADIVANAVTAALLPRLSWHLFGKTAPGIVAAFFWLLSAQLIPSWDTNFTVAGLLFLCLISAVEITKKKYLPGG